MGNPLDWFKARDYIASGKPILLGNTAGNITLGSMSSGALKASSATYFSDKTSSEGWGEGWGAYHGVGSGVAHGNGYGHGGDQPIFDYRSGSHENWEPGRGYGDADPMSYGY